MSNVTYEVSGGIAVIKFNRPEKLNTLTLSMYDDLGASFIRAQKDPQVAVVILTGEGDRAFCVGADLTESIPYLSRGHYIDEWDAAHFKHIKMNKPVIAAVNGMCMGGGFEIMLGTDIRVASEKAVFALPGGVAGNSSGGRHACKAGQTDTVCKCHGTDTDGRKDKRRESFGHGALKLCGEAGTGHGQGHGNSSQILVSQHLGGTDREGICNSPAGNTSGTSL